MRPLKIVAIVVGAILLLVGLALILPGGVLLWAHGTLRDDSGFFETSTRAMSTDGYALSTPDIDLHIGSGIDWVPKGATLGIRLRVTSDGSAPLFVGIGPTDQVAEYLAGVERDEVTGFGWFSAGVDYLHISGGAPLSLPSQQDFWVAREEGRGTQTLEWDVRSGNWTAVMMNGDGSAPLTANVSVGARFGLLLPIGIVLVVGGIVLFAAGIVLIVLGARPSRQEAVMQPPYGQPAQPQMPYQPPQPAQAQVPEPQTPSPPASAPAVPPPDVPPSAEPPQEDGRQRS